MFGRQAVAAGTSDSDVNDTWLGDADVVTAAQWWRKSGDRIRRRVQVELVLRVDVVLGRRPRQRAALRRAEPRRRHVLRVPRRRREQIGTQWTFGTVDTRRRSWHRRSVAWHSGRTSQFDRRTFPVLHSTCSWWVTTYGDKPSAVDQPTGKTQPLLFSGSTNE